MLKVLEKKKSYLPVFALLVLILIGRPLIGYAQYQAEGIFSNLTVSGLLSPAAADSDLLEDVTLAHRQALEDFYKSTNDKLIWSGFGRGSLDRARAVLAILDESWTHGLNPASYHAEEIRAILEEENLTREQQMRLEILMTDAVTSYARDLTGMRVNAAALGQKADYWRQSMAEDQILKSVSSSSDPAAMLRDLAPKGDLYKKLRKELVRLDKEQSKYDHLLPMNFGAGLFKPGNKHKDVAALRARLDLVYNPDNGPEQFYDDSLAHAVMRFQKQHGLKADGIVGPKTLELLNRSHRDQMEQIVANLERLRWLDEDKPDRYILVNIPSQMLWAVENGKTAHEMRVVVGKPARQTKQFKAEITGVRFNPTWTVPPGIKIKDMLPKLKEDPLALSASGIELTRDGKTLDPASIDWSSISRSDLMKIKMEQSAGDHNALGQIRVLMPNDYDIYLHDTNHRELFVNDERLLSSGCVRLSEPAKIASFVLSRNKDWSQEKMDKLIAAGRTVDVPVDQKFPVYIVYQTIWTDDQGQIIYGPDVYDLDKKLVRTLAGMKAYALPGGVEDTRQASAEQIQSADVRIASVE